MSWIQDEGEPLFIPCQDYCDSENLDPMFFSRPAWGSKVKEKNEKINFLESKSVKMQPLDFTDAASGELSFKTCFEKALDFRDLFSAYLKMEASIPREVDSKVLSTINSLFLSNVPPEMKGMVNRNNVGSIYASVLHRFEAELAVETARLIRACGVLKKFPPRKIPMVHCVLQKSFEDFFPHTQCLIPFKVLADLGVVPADALSFPLPGELICFALFWSVCRVHTAFGIIYSKKDGSTEFYWTIYNRSKSKVPVLDQSAFNSKRGNAFNMI